MRFIIPVESIVQNKGGVILYDPLNNKILKQYVHNKEWTRVGWRGGRIFEDYLIATDWNDLHYFNIKKWKYEKTFKKNTFNDLHYVEIYEDKLYVVNTGLDAIEIFKDPLDPKFKDIHFIFDKNPKIFAKRKFNLKEKYNEMMKIKPHSAHPNCISFFEGKAYITCFDKGQKMNTGEVIELKTGKRVLKNRYDCHDGLFYKGDFYLTWTRHAKVLKVPNFSKQSFPIDPKNAEKIKIGGSGWWRGMIVLDDFIFVFASDGYKKRKTTARMATINTKKGKIEKVKLPVVDGVHWDTIYEPNFYEG